MGSAGRFGRWIDNLGDIAFVLTALACEALVGAIAAYIPALIAASFAQYAVDSLVIEGGSTPVRSRLGHWGGVINFALVILLAWAPPPRWPARIVRELSPLIAILYLAAILERALGYRWGQAIDAFARARRRTGPRRLRAALANLWRLAAGALS